MLLGLRHPCVPAGLGVIGMWAVVVFALASAIQYFRKFWKHIDERVKLRRRRELMKQAKRERLAAPASEIGQEFGRRRPDLSARLA